MMETKASLLAESEMEASMAPTLLKSAPVPVATENRREPYEGLDEIRGILGKRNRRRR